MSQLQDVTLWSVSKQYRAPESSVLHPHYRSDPHAAVLHIVLDPKADVRLLFVGLFGGL